MTTNKVNLIKRFDHFSDSYWFHKESELPCQPWVGLDIYIGPCNEKPHEYVKETVEEVFVREHDSLMTCRLKTLLVDSGDLEGWFKHFQDHGWTRMDDSSMDPHTFINGFLKKKASNITPRQSPPISQGGVTRKKAPSTYKTAKKRAVAKKKRAAVKYVKKKAVKKKAVKKKAVKKKAVKKKAVKKKRLKRFKS